MSDESDEAVKFIPVRYVDEPEEFPILFVEEEHVRQAKED